MIRRALARKEASGGYFVEYNLNSSNTGLTDVNGQNALTNLSANPLSFQSNYIEVPTNTPNGSPNALVTPFDVDFEDQTVIVVMKMPINGSNRTTYMGKLESVPPPAMRYCVRTINNNNLAFELRDSTGGIATTNGGAGPVDNWMILGLSFYIDGNGDTQQRLGIMSVSYSAPDWFIREYSHDLLNVLHDGFKVSVGRVDYTSGSFDDAYQVAKIKIFNGLDNADLLAEMEIVRTEMAAIGIIV